ncbi:MAG: hypothetical protein HYX96_09445 [Chloroflexi bacterium]|nr:hypothetical protein [Chloroflexota bacterium]
MNDNKAEFALMVDLTSGRVSREAIDPGLIEKYIGGTGLAARVLWDALAPGVKPLGPENILVLAAGPLCGTLAPGSGRLDVAALSPITGTLGTSNAGGFFAGELRWAGYSLVVIRGRAAEPVYLWIDDDNVQLRSARHLWGRDAWETIDVLKQSLAPAAADRVRVAAIGPAGEKAVAFASITVDYHHSASRTGMGAVMGAKNLKAVAVRGTKGVRPARGEAFVAAVSEYLRGQPPFGWYTRILGFRRDAALAAGDIAGKHYQEGVPANWPNVLNQVEAAHYRRTDSPSACHACPQCCNTLEVKEGKFQGLVMGDWVNWATNDWAGVCAVDNIPAVGYCLQLCEKLGLDSGNCAEAVGFATELYQRGVISDKDTGGLKLAWGDEEVIFELIRRIGRREGLGDILAEGSARAAQRLGGEAPRYAVHVRGLAPLPTDPRLGTGWSGRMLAASHLTGVRGDNIKGAHLLPHYEKLPFIRPPETQGMSDDEYVRDYVSKRIMPESLKLTVYGSPPRVDPLAYGEGKACLMKFLEDFVMVPNALGMCLHIRMSPGMYARLYSAFSGADTSEDDILRLGERSWNLQRAFDARLGLRRGMYDLPDRFYEEGIGNGPARGAVLSREAVAGWLDLYYRVRGWDIETGIPTGEKLRELGLSDVAAALGGA